jgi:small subunit ribosomal protein S14
MSYSSFDKPLKQLKVKPNKMKKYLKHNQPKKRNTGVARFPCRRCGRIRAVIRKYGLELCRQCFRETATNLGFKKYN